MNSNKKYNEAAIKKFRKERMALFEDIEDLDIRILNKSVNKGINVAKKNTPVLSGFMRRAWSSDPAKKSKGEGVIKSLVNKADYSEYVNYGHRIVNKLCKTMGWVKGKFILEKAIGFIEKDLVKEFKNEVERINKKHDK